MGRDGIRRPLHTAAHPPTHPASTPPHQHPFSHATRRATPTSGSACSTPSARPRATRCPRCTGRGQRQQQAAEAGLRGSSSRPGWCLGQRTAASTSTASMTRGWVQVVSQAVAMGWEEPWGCSEHGAGCRHGMSWGCSGHGAGCVCCYAPEPTSCPMRVHKSTCRCCRCCPWKSRLLQQRRQQ